MKLGIFGGAFDPPHKVHWGIVNQLLDNKHLDKIIVMPSFQKMGKDTWATPEQRLDMCHKCFAEFTPEVIVSDWEIRNQTEGHALETYRHVVEDEKVKAIFNATEEPDVYFIIGGDCARNIEKWWHYDELKHEMMFCVFDRPNHTVTNITPGRGCIHIPYYNSKVYDDVSSSKVRYQLARGLDSSFEANTHPAVRKYIRDNNLYRQPELGEAKYLRG